MKTILSLSLLFSLIALPVLGALTDADLDKIRLIVKEETQAVKAELKAEVKAVKAELKAEIALIDTKIEGIDTRLRNVETDLAELRGRSLALSAIKDWGLALCALGALSVSIIALRKKQLPAAEPAEGAKKAVSQ